jgi:hypothetical protein
MTPLVLALLLLLLPVVRLLPLLVVQQLQERLSLAAVLRALGCWVLPTRACTQQLLAAALALS